MTEDKLLELAGALRRAQLRAYNPSGHAHGDPRDDHYVSISQVVSKTACQIYDKVVDGGDDDVPKYFTFKGDSLAEAHVKRCGDEVVREWHRIGERIGWKHGGVDEEVSVRLPIPDMGGWVLAGSMDSLLWALVDDGIYYYSVGEYKAHGVGTEEKDNVALRQGGLYLACYLASESGRFEHAPWSEHANTEHLRLGPHAPLGVFVNIADDHAVRGRVDFTRFTQEMLDEHLSFYLDKASHIAKAFIEGDRSYCEQWDLDHPDEFLPGYDPEDPDAVEEFLARYREVTLAINRLYGEKRDLEAAFDSTILAGDRTGWTGTNYAIEAPFVNGRRTVRVGDVESLIQEFEEAEGEAVADPQETAKHLKGLIRSGSPSRRRKVHFLGESEV